MKPIKWAAKSAIEVATAIVKKIPDFASKVCKFLKSVPSKLPTWLFDNKAINLVKNSCQKFSNYVSRIFNSAELLAKKEKVLNDIAKYGKRYAFMGNTPGKASRTGREEIQRMKKEGRIKTKKGIDYFLDRETEKWYPISKADMGHYPVDAVSWWNKTGRKYGAKSKKVREWMLSSKNYELQYYKINRSKGGKLKEKYLDPLKW